MNRFLSLLALLLSGCCCMPSSILEVFEEAREPVPPPVVSDPLPVVPPNFDTRLTGAHMTTASLTALALTGNVPQPRGLGSLYAGAADPVSGTVEHGVLVCQALVTGSGYDNGLVAGGADVMMRLSVGGAPMRRTRQSSTRLYAFPVRNISDGAALRVVVLDDDVFADDLIGRGSGTYMSGSANLHTEGAEVSCRLARGAAVDDPRRGTLAAIAPAFERLEGYEPDLRQEDNGYPSADAQNVTLAVIHALSWSTHDDPELLAELEAADRFEARWRAATGAAVERALAEEPPPRTSVQLGPAARTSATEVQCGPDALERIMQLGEAIEPGPGCITTVAFRSTTAGSMTVGEGGLELTGVDREGRAVRVAVRAQGGAEDWAPRSEVGQPVNYGADERRRFVIGFPTGEPVLLRAAWRGETALLRLQ